MHTPTPPCPLCHSAGGRIVFENPWLRVIHTEEDPSLPAFYRVIWRAHVREWSDLDAASQWHCMRAITAVEQAMRQTIAPHKINIASLGNMVAHLHWHIVARYEWDAYFPRPIWAPAHTPAQALPAAHLQELLAQRHTLEARMQTLLAAIDTADTPPIPQA